MKNKLDRWLKRWADSVLSDLSRSGFSGINVVEKILKDPGISTKGARHRILWWPRSVAIAEVSRAMHQVSPIEQACLVIRHGRPVKPDGRIFDELELSKNSSMTVAEIKQSAKDGRKTVKGILLKTHRKRKFCDENH